jgi:hypothetical protein
MGVQLTQTVAYELLELVGGKGRVKQTLSQLASPRALRAPGSLGAMKGELVAMTSSGRASLSSISTELESRDKSIRRLCSRSAGAAGLDS